MDVASINWHMREIAYFMLELSDEGAVSSQNIWCRARSCAISQVENDGRARFVSPPRALRWEKPRLERFFWHGYRVSLYLFPYRLAGTKRLLWWLERIANALAEKGTALWIAPELEAVREDWQPPLPDASLAAEILRCQPFRENLVLLADAEEAGGQWNWGHENGVSRQKAGVGGSRCLQTGTRPAPRIWQEDFLRLVSTNLNGLYLVGQRESEWEHFSDWLYEESGLPVCFPKKIPKTDGRKTVLVELRANGRILQEHPEFGSLYVDLTSDAGKKRQIRAKRADISYISARNYLDTALKARYNAI